MMQPMRRNSAKLRRHSSPLTSCNNTLPPVHLRVMWPRLWGLRSVYCGSARLAVLKPLGQGIQFSQQDIIDIWRGRTGLCLTPSYARHSLRHQFEHLAFGGSDNLPEGLQPRLKMKRLIARLLASEDTEI